MNHRYQKARHYAESPVSPFHIRKEHRPPGKGATVISGLSIPSVEGLGEGQRSENKLVIIPSPSPRPEADNSDVGF